ncbi:hypothetical protein [Fluviicola taffensis]|uniref:DUF2019 domain-containing protein n=1 Tax=Fluviicola taffensis (strain DSM 16823 / NCIMB 13979 / RW262) TaxID=755732 RepID=F2IC81_FLUTR|nr:hypothetical protein [Fluviicola taffensis]AEA44327.1 hypothetical protein Fluta_2341 [Fluviicola taffensis DSM 16823]
MKNLFNEFDQLFSEYSRTQKLLYKENLANSERNKKLKEANEVIQHTKVLYEKFRYSHEIQVIEPFLNDEDPYIRLIAATYSFSYNQELAEKTLRDLIEQVKGIVAFNAKITLDVWVKGLLP